MRAWLVLLTCLAGGCAGTHSVVVEVSHPPRVTGTYHRVQVASRVAGGFADLDLNRELGNYLLSEFAEQGSLAPAAEDATAGAAEGERGDLLALVVEGHFGSTMGLSAEETFVTTMGLEKQRPRTRHWYLAGHFELWDQACDELVYSEPFAVSSTRGQGDVPALFGLYEILDTLGPRILDAAVGGHSTERRRLISP